MQAALSDPTKKEQVIRSVVNDPDIADLRADPEVGPLFQRLEAQDMSVMTEMMQKPEVFGRLQQVIKKYI